MKPYDDGNPDTPPPETCQYRGYRNNATQDYSLSSVYWHVFAARLAFVVVFEVCKKRKITTISDNSL